MSTSFDLPAALGGTRRTFDAAGWPLSYYIDASGGDGVPLLLVHSINAAASAYEVKPIYDHYRAHRPVAALDLPGYGFSKRRAQRYTPRTMVDAIQAWVEEVRTQTGHPQVDVLACSVACQYLARAVIERPDRYRSVALVSPAGVDSQSAADAPAADATRGRPGLYRALTGSTLVSKTLFKGLATRPSIRFFLEKTWGGKDVDPDVIDYAWRTAHQPGARHAPWSFLAGYLFSSDAAALYRRIPQPVWLAYGTRSAFSDRDARDIVARHAASTVVSFDAGALPHFQQLDAFAGAYDAFVSGL